MKRWTKLVIAILGVWMLSACSSLLYYPTNTRYVEVEKLKYPPADVHFTSEDGTKLHGWYFHGNQEKPKAVFLFFHGNAQNLSSHFASLFWILDYGYDFFIFDYRGYGQSEGTPSPEGTIKDGRAALKWILGAKKPETPLYLFGQSLGGAVALRVAGETAKEKRPHIPFEKVIVDSTFPSYARAGSKVLSKFWLTWPLQWLPRLVLSDEFAPVSWEIGRRVNYIAEISPRKLHVVHGTLDPTVDFSLGEEVFAYAKEPKEFLRVENGVHTDFLFRENFSFRKKFLKWLED